MRTTINRTTINESGVVFSLVAADAVNGMQFQNNENQILVVNNGDVADITVTIDYAADKFGRDGSKVITVAAGEEKHIGPFLKKLYNQGGYVYVDFSEDTNVTVGVISLYS